MDDATIERIASAVATKIINARLAELTLVREEALSHGRKDGAAEVARSVRRMAKETLAFCQHIRGLPAAELSLSLNKAMAAQLDEYTQQLMNQMGAHLPPEDAV